MQCRLPDGFSGKGKKPTGCFLAYVACLLQPTTTGQSKVEGHIRDGSFAVTAQRTLHLLLVYQANPLVGIPREVHSRTQECCFGLPVCKPCGGWSCNCLSCVAARLLAPCRPVRCCKFFSLPGRVACQAFRQECSFLHLIS